MNNEKIKVGDVVRARWVSGEPCPLHYDSSLIKSEKIKEVVGTVTELTMTIIVVSFFVDRLSQKLDLYIPRDTNEWDVRVLYQGEGQDILVQERRERIQGLIKQAVQKQVEREAMNAYPMAIFRDTIFRNLPNLAPLCMNWGSDVSTGFPSTFLNEYRLTLGDDEKVIVVSLGNDYLLSARIEDNPEETEHNVLLAIHELEEYNTTF
jgi:hypothetical protein